MRKNRSRTFRAIDGEGMSRDPHNYVLLTTRDQSIQSREGLSSHACFEFVLSQPKAATLVAFAFGYDVNMFLRDLDRETLDRLWNQESAQWRGFTLCYQPGRRFSVRYGSDVRTIFDVFGFFQSSFIKALEKWGIGTPDLIAEMKAARGSFTWSRIARVREYARTECALLESLCENLEESCVTAGYRPLGYYGAGAIAGAMLRTHRSRAFQCPTPREIRSAVNRSYYGGRIELLRYGSHDRVYTADLRSAYPHALRNQPCLACGTWSTVIGEAGEPGSYSVNLVDWDYVPGAVLYPFPWRDHTGRVYYPATGTGFVWQPEIDAARALEVAGIIRGRTRVIASYRYTPRCDHDPFGWVPEVYAERARRKIAGDGSEKVLKLGLNSLYGKCAQRVGYRGQRPPSQQFEWAGHVTSCTRATLLRASVPLLLRDQVIAFATDAVISTAPLPIVPGPDLGSWETETFNRGVYVQSGVYWHDGAPKLRGIRPHEMCEDQVQHGWQHWQRAIEYRAERFRTLGMHLRGVAGWRDWITSERRLFIHPPPKGKRVERTGEPTGPALAHSTARTLPAVVQSAGRLSHPPKIFEAAKMMLEIRASGT